MKRPVILREPDILRGVLNVALQPKNRVRVAHTNPENLRMIDGWKSTETLVYHIKRRMVTRNRRDFLGEPLYYGRIDGSEELQRHMKLRRILPPDA